MLSLTKSYGEHVLKQGQEIAVRKTYRGCCTPTILAKNRYEWGSMVFEHPSTFDTLAMGTKKKEEIKKDLIKFSKGKDYYAKIGKAWRRGYLLYGPPGTGKSSMIAAMASLLDYDVYDI